MESPTLAHDRSLTNSLVRDVMWHVAGVRDENQVIQYNSLH